MATVSPHVAGLAPTIGRKDELCDLRTAFLTGPNVRVLTGMGGVGKTSLARAYAQRHVDDYTLIWWIRAEHPAAIDAEFRSLLEVLLPPGEPPKITDARTKAFDLLARHNGPWLLILDNVLEAADANGLLPPTGNGQVLITSRSPDWPTSSTVRPLGTDAAIELLTSQSGDQDPVSASALATELGGLPLALTQAAGFVRTNASDLATYLRLYRDRSAELHEVGRPANYPHTVATTWQLAMDRLSDAALTMLNVLAFYAPDAIPVHTLFASTDELARHRAIGELRAYSLITPAGSSEVTVHRLIQAVTRNRLHADLTSQEWADKARELIMAAVPAEPVTAISLAAWSALRTHVRATIDHLPPAHPHARTARQTLAFWTGQAGDTAQARDLFGELLLMDEQMLGAEHPDTLATRQSFAHWTAKSGDPARAQDQFGELLHARRHVLGLEHPDTLTTQHSFAHWTAKAGDPARGRDLLAELLPIRERVLGSEHPDTLTTRAGLARWHVKAGDADRGRTLLAESLPIYLRVLGPEHPDTLIMLHNLAYVTGHAGESERARDMFIELLPIRERVLGAENPETLASRSNLAYWTGVSGDAARARDLFAELLPIRERILGYEHPDTMSTRRELAYWTEMADAPGGSADG